MSPEEELKALRAEVLVLAEDVGVGEGVGLLYWSDHKEFPLIAAILAEADRADRAAQDR